MTSGIKRTKVWKLYVRDEYSTGWTKWMGMGISKSRTKAQKEGKLKKDHSNRRTQYKVIQVTSKGYSPPYETL